MSNELIELRKRKEELESSIKTNDKILEELLEDEKVKQFFAVSKENEELINRLRRLKTNLVVAEMENCAHVFVKTSVVVDRSDSHRNCKDEVFHCVKCGLTNYYSVLELPDSMLDEEKRFMSYIFAETSDFGVLISKNICSLETAKAVYEILTIVYPKIMHKELKERFSLLYPMIEESRNRDEYDSLLTLKIFDGVFKDIEGINPTAISFEEVTLKLAKILEKIYPKISTNKIYSCFWLGKEESAEVKSHHTLYRKSNDGTAKIKK